MRYAFDSNILLYAVNSTCEEHQRASISMEQAWADTHFVICDLALIEAYILLRNPFIIKPPLSASAAVELLSQYRPNPSWRVIDYPGHLMEELWSVASKPDFPRRAIFDARLALTLRFHQVDKFITRNTKHFRGYGFELINPIDD